MLSKTKSRTAGKNLKTTIITALLLFATVSGAVAQEKWEYAHVVFAEHLGGKMDAIWVSTSGKGTEKFEYEKKKLNDYITDFTPLLNYIQSMTDKGWEIVAVVKDRWEQDTFYLRKKKP